ncbi:MAG: hypothetical protein QOE58_3207 [Actinomycetota bacterium]|nr:hypothetical protein [Actinomycetota bacterium]
MSATYVMEAAETNVGQPCESHELMHVNLTHSLGRVA